METGPSAREVAWPYLAGAAAGALAGLVIGGVGGRLVMLVLRLATPAAEGVTTDDGFTVGRVSTATLGLLLAMAALGGIAGVGYAALRGAVAPRLRAPLSAALGAATGGAAFVHADGIDYHVLDPVLLAIVAFCALPGLALGCTALAAERLIARGSGDRRRVGGAVAAAALGTLALPLAGVAAAVAVAARRVPSGLRRPAARAARLAVPAALLGLTLVGAVDLVGEAREILDGR